MLARNIYPQLNEPSSNGWRWGKTLHSCALDRSVRKVGRCLALLGAYLAAAVQGLSAENTSAAPAVETIVAGMARARNDNQALFRAYVVTRDYKLFGKERDKTKSQVIADITFVPPDLKKYVILAGHQPRISRPESPTAHLPCPGHSPSSDHTRVSLSEQTSVFASSYV